MSERWTKMPQASHRWDALDYDLRALGVMLFLAYQEERVEFPGDWRQAVARRLAVDGRKRPGLYRDLDRLAASGLLSVSGTTVQLLWTERTVRAHRSGIGPTTTQDRTDNVPTTSRECADDVSATSRQPTDNGSTSVNQNNSSDGNHSIGDSQKRDRREVERASENAPQQTPFERPDADLVFVNRRAAERGWAGTVFASSKTQAATHRVVEQSKATAASVSAEWREVFELVFDEWVNEKPARLNLPSWPERLLEDWHQVVRAVNAKQEAAA